MFDDVISTGLQAVLTEVFESVDKDQLNVSLVGDIFKESHLELTDLRLKKALFKDMNLPVDIKEGLVGKLVIQGLSGVMTGDPVTVTVSEVLVLLAPAEGLSDPEACLAARRLAATMKEMFANRYAEDFLEDVLGIKGEDKLSVQGQNKLNRKLLRHIVRKLLAGVSIILQTVHVRFELPAGGEGAGETPVKASSGVGGGGACDAVGVMLPSVTLRTCHADHPSFAKFAGSTPLDRVSANSAALPRRGGDAGQETKKNFCIVRKRAMLSNLQVYGDYGVDSYVTDISTAVSAARNKATNPRRRSGASIPGSSGSSSNSSSPGTAGAVAAARAVRSVFQQKWKSERHALLFKPLGVDIGVEVHQWDVPGGKAVVPVYRVRRVNVSVGELQAVMDSEQGRVLGTAIEVLVTHMRRSRFNRFVPQAYLPLRNLPPPKVRPPRSSKDGNPGGILPTVETWSWSDVMEVASGGSVGKGKPRSVSEAVLKGGFKKEGGAWARAMWRFAGTCVRHDVRSGLTRKLPASLPQWDGTISAPNHATSNGVGVVPVGSQGTETGAPGDGQDSSPVSPNSYRVTYLRLHARTLMAREAKNIAPRVPDVRRMGVPRGRDPLSLGEMWEMARVESFAPGDEVVFLRTAARVSSHYEWGRMRRARLSAKAAAEKRGLSAEAAAAAGAAASVGSTWTAKDDAAVLARLDALRSKRFVVALMEKAKAKAGVEAGTASEDDDDDEEEIAKMQFAATAVSGFSDDEEDDDEESDDDEDEEEDDEEEGDDNGKGVGIGGIDGKGSKFSLADIAAKAKETSVSQSSQAAAAAAVAAASAKNAGGFGGKKGVGGKAGEVWAKLLGFPRVVFQIESAGIELRTRISGGSRRPLVALSAGGVSGSVEGDEARRLLWWELRVGQVTFRDLCSSWGSVSKAGAAPVAKTLLSGSVSGVEGREWAYKWDTSGAAARSFLVLRMIHDPNRVSCGLFEGSAASLAQLRTHVVVGCVTGKVMAVFNAAARDVLLGSPKNKTNKLSSADAKRNASSLNSGVNVNDSARQLRVTLGSVYAAFFSGCSRYSVEFRAKRKKGPKAAMRALSLARGAVASGCTSSSTSKGEVDSKELYKVVAGMLPGDFEVRLHTSEVVVQVDSRTQDLLEAGKVALEAIGEDKAAADMKGGAAATDSIKLEVNVSPVKIDACRSSHPSPELWVDTGFLRTKLRAPDKAVEAVVTALLTSAQRTKAAMALLSGEEHSEDNA